MVPASPNFITIFYESNTEGINFRIMFVFYVYVMCVFCKSPEVTLCGWRGSINKHLVAGRRAVHTEKVQHHVLQCEGNLGQFEGRVDCSLTLTYIIQ